MLQKYPPMSTFFLNFNFISRHVSTLRVLLRLFYILNCIYWDKHFLALTRGLIETSNISYNSFVSDTLSIFSEEILCRVVFLILNFQIEKFASFLRLLSR